MNAFNQNENGSEEMNKGMTGGTGNIGQTGGPALTQETIGTGGTGASGLGGEIGKAISSITDMNESVENFSRKVAYAGLYGVTGGEGQIGSLDDAIKDNDSMAELSKKFSAKITAMNDIEVILKDINECQTSLELVLSKSNAVNAFFAYMQGKRLLRLQGLRSQQGSSRTWIKWIDKQLPHIKKKPRENYMNVACIPGVENYFEYGVVRLAEFGVIYSSKDDEEKQKWGNNPLEGYLATFNVKLNSNYGEHKEYIDAVFEITKLNRIGVEFTVEEMVSFLRKEERLTSKEREHLKKLFDEDPQKPIDLLNKIVARELQRKNLIAGTDTPPPVKPVSDNNQDEANSEALLKGPNIERMVVTLCKSLEPVATKGVKLDNAIDRNSLVQLKGYIEQLLAMTDEDQEKHAEEGKAA